MKNVILIHGQHFLHHHLRTLFLLGGAQHQEASGTTFLYGSGSGRQWTPSGWTKKFPQTLCIPKSCSPPAIPAVCWALVCQQPSSCWTLTGFTSATSQSEVQTFSLFSTHCITGWNLELIVSLVQILQQDGNTTCWSLKGMDRRNDLFVQEKMLLNFQRSTSYCFQWLCLSSQSLDSWLGTNNRDFDVLINNRDTKMTKTVSCLHMQHYTDCFDFLLLKNKIQHHSLYIQPAGNDKFSAEISQYFLTTHSKLTLAVRWAKKRVLEVRTVSDSECLTRTH